MGEDVSEGPWDLLRYVQRSSRGVPSEGAIVPPGEAGTVVTEHTLLPRPVGRRLGPHGVCVFRRGHKSKFVHATGFIYWQLIQLFPEPAVRAAELSFCLNQ